MSAMILCVEDEPQLRADLVEELVDAGYETDEAANGLEALGKIARAKPDLVICDVTMPVMNGVEMLKELRVNYDAAGVIPVIFLSALEDVSSIAADIGGAWAYLTKPVEYAAVLDVVRKCLGEAATRAAAA